MFLDLPVLPVIIYLQSRSKSKSAESFDVLHLFMVVKYNIKIHTLGKERILCYARIANKVCVLYGEESLEYERDLGTTLTN